MKYRAWQVNRPDEGRAEALARTLGISRLLARTMVGRGCTDAQQAKALLREHRALLDEIALYLLQKETITGDEFMVYVNAENRKLEAPKDEAEASDAEAAPAEDAADKTDENPNPTEGA